MILLNPYVIEYIDAGAIVPLCNLEDWSAAKDIHIPHSFWLACQPNTCRSREVRRRTKDGGREGNDYASLHTSCSARSSSFKIHFFRTVLPEPVLKYFSSERACFSSGKDIDTKSSYGL